VLTANHEGLRIARLFRGARNLDGVRCCDLDVILAEDDIEIVESQEVDPGYTACLVRVPGTRGGGIFLARGQDEGRRRFSLAHELGHYHIPRHRTAGEHLQCAEVDLRCRSQDAKRLEWEANEFASELLMPALQFRADTARKDICFSSVYELAAPEMYHVSVTAAAWRVVQTSLEPCALVVAQEQRVQWVARSRNFPPYLVERNQILSPETLAASAFRGEGPSASARDVDWFQWLEHEPAARGTLVESTHAVPRLRQVLSLLWMPDFEGPSDTDDVQSRPEDG
jgi:hypothetical protein